MSTNTPTLSPSLPEYLLQLSILQLVTQSGPFTHTRTQPVHALAHLARDYIHLLANTAKHAAEHAGRTDVSVWDVGRALGEFGPGGLAELAGEVRSGSRRRRVERVEGDGEEEQVDNVERIRELGEGLREVIEVRPPAEPIAQLSFQPLTKQEVDLLDASRSRLTSTLGSPSSTSSHRPLSDDDDDEPIASHPQSDDLMLSPKPDTPALALTFDSYPPPLSSPAAPSSAVPAEATDDDDGCQWRDRTLIPPYIPPFLPPFPGHEKRGALSEAARRKRDREEQEAAAGPSARVRHDAPFEQPVPYAQSQMALAHGPEDLPPLSPEPSVEAELDADGVPRRRVRRRRRSVEAEGRTDSLQWYRDVAGAVLQTAPAWPLKQNQARRQAATVVGQPKELITGDSLFGNVPLVGQRSAALTAGYLQDGLDFAVHPFNTPIPHTISHPVPLRPSPHALLMAAPAHNRAPSVMGNLADFLGGSGSDRLAMFSRMTRMGPPGPLDGKGEAEDYAWVNNTGVVELSVEWQEKSADQRLPEEAMEGAAGGGGGVGIKLKLPAGRGGTASLAGSPAPWTAEGTPALAHNGVAPGEILPELPEAAIDGANGVDGGGDVQGEHLKPNGFSAEHRDNQPPPDTLPEAAEVSAGMNGSPAVKQEQDESAHGQHALPVDGTAEPNPDDSLDYDPALVDLNDPAHYTPAEVHQPLPDVGEGESGGQEVDPVMAFMQQTLLAGLGGGEAAVEGGEAGEGGYGLGMDVDGQQ